MNLKTFRIYLARTIGHARFIRFGIRDRIARVLVPPRACIDFPFVVSIGSVRVAGNLNNYIDWSIYNYGQYERGLLTAIAQWRPLLGPNPVFWDVGANVGQHSLVAASMGYRVEAFEPLPEVREKMLTSLALNSALSVTVHPFGLGERDADAKFVSPSNENRGTGHFDDLGDTVLTIRRGDGVPAPPPTLLKIDVEGYEGEVLLGLSRTISEARPVILFEFSERTRMRSNCIPAIVPTRYRTLQLSGHEKPRIVSWNGAGKGEMVLLLPEERAEALIGSI